MIIGMVHLRFKQGSENARFVAAADFLNEGMSTCSRGGFDRNTVRREVKKFCSYTKQPGGGQLMKDTFFTLERMLKIERNARLDPRFCGLRGAELVEALADQHDFVEGFLTRLILPDIRTDLLRA